MHVTSPDRISCMAWTMDMDGLIMMMKMMNADDIVDYDDDDDED